MKYSCVKLESEGAASIKINKKIMTNIQGSSQTQEITNLQTEFRQSLQNNFKPTQPASTLLSSLQTGSSLQLCTQ